MLCYDPLESRVWGAQSAWCPPNLLIGGACALSAPPAPPPMMDSYLVTWLLIFAETCISY